MRYEIGSKLLNKRIGAFFLLLKNGELFINSVYDIRSSMLFLRTFQTFSIGLCIRIEWLLNALSKGKFYSTQNNELWRYLPWKWYNLLLTAALLTVISPRTLTLIDEHSMIHWCWCRRLHDRLWGYQSINTLLLPKIEHFKEQMQRHCVVFASGYKLHIVSFCGKNDSSGLINILIRSNACTFCEQSAYVFWAKDKSYVWYHAIEHDETTLEQCDSNFCDSSPPLE